MDKGKESTSRSGLVSREPVGSRDIDLEMSGSRALLNSRQRASSRLGVFRETQILELRSYPQWRRHPTSPLYHLSPRGGSIKPFLASQLSRHYFFIPAFWGQQASLLCPTYSKTPQHWFVREFGGEGNAAKPPELRGDDATDSEAVHLIVVVLRVDIRCVEAQVAGVRRTVCSRRPEVPD